jgi:hypothetical protein
MSELNLLRPISRNTTAHTGIKMDVRQSKQDILRNQQ